MKKENTTPKSITPAVWGILAAVLVAAVLLCVLLIRSQRAEEETFTLPPMIYVQDGRWLFERDITAEAAEWESEFQYMGEVTSVVAETEYVEENFQANFPALGDALFRWEEYIVLYHGEEVWLMRPMAEVQTQRLVE